MNNPSEPAEQNDSGPAAETQPVNPAIVPGTSSPTTPQDARVYAVTRGAEDRSRLVNAALDHWGEQQKADRELRGKYANWLLWGFYGQAALVNVAFFAIGRNWLQIDPWTARLFILAVFGELAAMVFFIVKYLFRSTGDDVLKVAGQIVPPSARYTSRRRTRRGSTTRRH